MPRYIKPAVWRISAHSHKLTESADFYAGLFHHLFKLLAVVRWGFHDGAKFLAIVHQAQSILVHNILIVVRIGAYLHGIPV